MGLSHYQSGALSGAGQRGAGQHGHTLGQERSGEQDSVTSYFECITACSVDDGECVTRCVEVLREEA